jgi:hypothetical protein
MSVSAQPDARGLVRDPNLVARHLPMNVTDQVQSPPRRLADAAGSYVRVPAEVNV